MSKQKRDADFEGLEPGDQIDKWPQEYSFTAFTARITAVGKLCIEKHKIVRNTYLPRKIRFNIIGPDKVSHCYDESYLNEFYHLTEEEAVAALQEHFDRIIRSHFKRAVKGIRGLTRAGGKATKAIEALGIALKEFEEEGL